MGRLANMPDIQVLLAYHESAHAVVAIKLGWDVSYLSLITDGDSLCGCRVEEYTIYSDAYQWDKETKSKARKAILYDLAGIAAEVFINGNVDEFGDDDWDSAYVKAKHISGNPQPYLDYALRRTRKMVRANWHYIAAVANGLLSRQTLIGVEILLIMKEYDASAVDV
jgi:hypothetical protein